MTIKNLALSDEDLNIVVQGGNSIVYSVNEHSVYLNDERIAVPDVVPLNEVCINDGMLTIGGFYYSKKHQQFIPMTLRALWTYLWNRKKFYTEI